jgi:hypothetical protein
VLQRTVHTRRRFVVADGIVASGLNARSTVRARYVENQHIVFVDCANALEIAVEHLEYYQSVEDWNNDVDYDGGNIGESALRAC